MFNPTRIKSFFCITEMILQDLKRLDRLDRLLQEFRNMINLRGLALIMLDNILYTQSLLLLNHQAFCSKSDFLRSSSSLRHLVED